MSASPGSPSREAAPEAATPETIQRPAQRQRLAPRDCSRCGTVHAPNCCTLPLAKGIGKVFHAGLPGACQICFQAFETTGETKDRSLILSFMEQGYCHRDCVVKMLKPYYGPEAKPLLQRLEEALVGQTQAIQEFVRRAILDVEFLKKAYEICKAAPGAGKTLVCAHVRRGPRVAATLRACPVCLLSHCIHCIHCIGARLLISPSPVHCHPGAFPHRGHPRADGVPQRLVQPRRGDRAARAWRAELVDPQLSRRARREPLRDQLYQRAAQPQGVYVRRGAPVAAVHADH